MASWSTSPASPSNGLASATRYSNCGGSAGLLSPAVRHENDRIPVKLIIENTGRTAVASLLIEDVHR